jgi:hypothetical protein
MTTFEEIFSMSKTELDSENKTYGDKTKYTSLLQRRNALIINSFNENELDKKDSKLVGLDQYESIMFEKEPKSAEELRELLLPFKKVTSPKKNKSFSSKENINSIKKDTKFDELNFERQLDLKKFFSYIHKNYKSSEYLNKNFIIKELHDTNFEKFKKYEIINSYTLQSNGKYNLNGVTIRANLDTKLYNSIIILSYIFYKDDKKIENNIEKGEFGDGFYINDQFGFVKNKDGNTALVNDEPVNSILKQINEKIIDEKVYPWLNELIDNKENKSLMIIDLETEDKVNFEIPVIKKSVKSPSPKESKSPSHKESKSPSPKESKSFSSKESKSPSPKESKSFSSKESVKSLSPKESVKSLSPKESVKSLSPKQSKSLSPKEIIKIVETLEVDVKEIELIRCNNNFLVVKELEGKNFIFYDLKSFKMVKKLIIDYIAITDFILNNDYLFIASYNNIEILDLKTFKNIKTIENNSDKGILKLSLNKKYLFSGSINEIIEIWDLKTFELVKKLDNLFYMISDLKSNEKYLFVMFHYSNDVKIFDLKTFKSKILSFDITCQHLDLNDNYLVVHLKNRADFFNLETFELDKTFQGLFIINNKNIFNKNLNKYIDNPINVIDIKTLKPIQSIQTLKNENFIFSNLNEKYLFMRSFNKIKIWEILN